MKHEVPRAAAGRTVAGAVRCEAALFGIELVNNDLIRSQVGDEQKMIIWIGADEVWMRSFLSLVVRGRSRCDE